MGGQGVMKKIYILRFSLIIAALILSGCDEDIRTRTIDINGGISNSPIPLKGLDQNKPITKELKVQAAFNNDTIFFYIQFRGNRGDAHNFLRFTGAKWREEGFHRRDSQATLDQDPRRGRTDVPSTSAESSLAVFFDDPNSISRVPGFAKYGCFMVCHDDSQYMPQWDGISDLTMYLPDNNENISAGRLDLWLLRMARSNPIGWGDDQSVAKKAAFNGGRSADSGEAPFEVNINSEGKPKYLLNPAQSEGRYSFSFNDILHTQYKHFMRPNSEAPIGDKPLFAESIDYYTATVISGYVPVAGDTIPAIRLQQPTDSRADVLAIGSFFEPDNSTEDTGTMHIYLQRQMDTLNFEDVTFVENGVYNIAFAVNTGYSSVRDHYVSFPMTLSLGSQGADIVAGKFPGNSFLTKPNFSNTSLFPITTFNVVLPGITSYEFLSGENTGKKYYPAGSSEAIGQIHGGSTALQSADVTCRDCHTINNEPWVGKAGTYYAGKLSELVLRRGGIYTPTPMQP